MRPAFFVFGTALLCLAISAPVSAAELNSDQINLTAARENPMLRSYFARIHTLSPDTLGQYRTGVIPNDRESGLERWQRQVIDLQIEEFVQDVYQKAQGLEEHWEQLDRMRKGRHDADSWRSELRELEKQANSLRESLKAVFPDLSERKSKELDLDKASRDRDPGPEILLIGRQVAEVQKGLSELLFQPTFVTSVAALRAGSPLDSLNRISTVAKAVRESR